MEGKYAGLLKERCGQRNYKKLAGLDNPKLHDFVGKYVAYCNPASVFVCDDSPEDLQFIRQEAIRTSEERELSIPGHTVHFDGYYDQARDEKNTKFLVPEGVDLGPNINAIDKVEGLGEIHAILKNIMQGHRLYVQFFCLGPTNSEFSIPAVQLTDSSYVAHSQDLLYRLGYAEFKKLGASSSFFKFVHSQGELAPLEISTGRIGGAKFLTGQASGVSKNIEMRRIYIDIQDNIVYSVNTQYGGNTIGHKKLAMRLAINKASREHWLTEHMFLMGVHGPRNRVSYFTGAFPSLCGKTSTSMLGGETIVGDDIVYLRVKDQEIRAVNVEKGIFGIINGINSGDDPILWKVLNLPDEIIFSNVLVTEGGDPYWVGRDGRTPQKGINHSGQWVSGKKDAQGNEIPPSHPNARFTLDMRLLKNLDPELDNPEGVVVRGIIYGGRDSDTWVPVEESFNWMHGVIIKGASLESETTAAALGKEGVRKFNPMSNLPFLSIPIGRYIENYINFGASLKSPPPIFSVNYFLKNSDGNFMNDKTDKAVWLKWMELRANGDVDAIKTPTGYIPKYEDIKRLFEEVLDKDYTKEDYIEQFTLRIPENLAKIERVVAIYRTKVPDTPYILFEVLEEQRQRLKDARTKYGDYVPPGVLAKG